MIGSVDSVTLTGSSLTLDDVLAVARRRVRVEIAPSALEQMARAREVSDRVIEGGGQAYGVTTGVGSRKSFVADAPGHDRLLVRQHVIAQGSPVAHEVVRATALRLANALASASTVARPALAQRVVDALNDDRLPAVRVLGSIGMSDLAQMADLADGILGDFELARGEGIALLNQASFSTAYGALAFADALVLLDALDCAGALDLEAFGANPSVLHPRVGEVRPYPGLQTTLVRLRCVARGKPGRDTGAAGSAQLPDARPAERCCPRRSRVRRCADRESSSMRPSRTRSCSSTRGR